MTSEQWVRAKELFQVALEQPAEARAPFLAAACNGDAEVRAEVENLLAGHAQAGSFLEKPAIASAAETPTFAANELISGRFRVIRFLGRGGMGEVYEAKDLELGERVALKTIRQDISSDPNAVLRFKQEIQLARRVTHPNVCRIFDFERHVRSGSDADPSSSTITFLTMELLEGETLAQRLRRTARMTPVEALPLVKQMAEALAAAHDAGIIHRDFKPSNVILVPRNSSSTISCPRAVVTDFGLARAAALARSSITTESVATSITGRGQLLGTVAYMAPEQLEGRPVSIATDVYALGLVMYEMVAGVSPFREDLPMVAIFKRVKEPPPSPRTHVPDLDPVWESVILCCLAIDPASRFQNARDVEVALGAASRADRPATQQDHGRLGARRESGPRLLGSATAIANALWPTRRRSITAKIAAVVIFLALSAAALRLYVVRRQTAQVPAGSLILLTDIENDTGSPEINGVGEVLRNQLKQSSYVRLMDETQVRQTLERMAQKTSQKLDPIAAREVAYRGGAPLVIYGLISKLAQEYTLALKIERIGNEPTFARAHWDARWDAPSAMGLFDTVDKASRWARQIAGEAAKDIDATDRPPQDVTTDSWEALGLYASARDLRRSNHLEEAISLLNEAVHDDPEFALAYMALGDTYDSLGRYSQSFDAYHKALGVLGARRLDKKEELRIRGLAAWEVQDYSASAAAFSTYSTLYPDDYLGWFYQANPLMMLGQPQRAIAVLTKAEKLEPSAYYMPGHLAKNYLILGQFDEVRKQIARLRNLKRNDDADYFEGLSSFLQGQDQRAEELFVRLQDSKDPLMRSAGFSVHACLLGELGRYEEAIRLLQSSSEEDLSTGNAGARSDRLLALSYLRYRTGDRTGCRQASLDAIALDHSFLHTLKAGTLLARAGFPADARRVLSSLGQQQYPPISTIVRYRLIGEIDLAEGRNGAALREFQKADAVDPPANARDYLARAFIATGKPQAAIDIYAKIVASPGQIWQEPELYPPGFLTDMAFQYGALSARVGNTNAAGILTSYLKDRERADRGLLEVAQARIILAHIQGQR